MIHGSDLDEPLWLEGGRLAVLHAGGLGSIALATDATQAIVERTTYTAFGVPVRQGSAGVQPFAFTGREWDVELGLYYYRARYYDPEVGRFLSRDPLGLAAGPNPYTYVDNSPTNATDPAGTRVLSPCSSRRPWTPDCFWLHYLSRSGQAVDLVEVGLLPAIQGHDQTKLITSTVKNKLELLARTRARSLCNKCDKGTKAFGIAYNVTS